MEINYRAAEVARIKTLPWLQAGLTSTLELLIDVLEKDI
jgi:hypothetical protein